MRKMIMLAAMTAAVVAAVTLTTNRAEAMTLSAPAGVNAAIDGVDIIDQVHCRPWVHWHPWGWSHGCRIYRPYYSYSYRHYRPQRHFSFRRHHQRY